MPSPEIMVAPRQTARSQPKAFSPRASFKKTGYQTLLLALTTSGLLWLCYFPVAWGWLAWVALVPFLCLVRSPGRSWVIFQDARASGLYFFLPAIQWMRVADPRMYATWIGLAFYCSLYFPLALYLIRFLDRRTSLPLVLTVPVVWTALEFLRSTFGGGFSWYLLAHSQHNLLPLIQIADLTGAYGVTFLIAAVNALLVEILWSRSTLRVWLADPDALPRWNRIGLLMQGLAILAVLLGSSAYGFWRLGQEQIKPGPRIALLQSNLDQRLRNASAVAEDAARSMVNHFRDLADLAAKHQPDLIVWPETSWPYEWQEEAGGEGPIARRSREMAEDMAVRWHTNLLVGMNSAILTDGQHKRRYNSAILIDRDGHVGGHYDKIHRVPFGEYVPFRDWLPWMNYLAPYDFDYSIWPGQKHTRMPLRDAATEQPFHFGVLICYEDTDAEVALPFGSDGEASVDFVLNISNDGWFDGTSEHDQHLAICRFRAIECRRTVARAVNMGISAIIDSNGHVLQPQELSSSDTKADPEFHVWSVPMHKDGAVELPVSQWHEYKKIAGILLASVPIDSRASLYVRLGDWLPWTCWLVLGIAFVLSWVRPERRKQTP